MISLTTFKRIASLFALAGLPFAANAQVFHGGVTSGAAETSAQPAVVTPGLPTGTADAPPIPTLGIDERAATGRFLNLSTRGWVSGSEKHMIAGLVVGEGGRAVLIRAVGPSLVNHGVTDFLPRPHLDLRNSAGEPVTTRAAWKDLSDADKAEARRFAQKTGAFPLIENSDDAVLFIYLEAGIYTCIVTGIDDSSGTVLVECYEIPAMLVMPSGT